MHPEPESRKEIAVCVSGYGCVSSAGEGCRAFWNGLVEGRDHSRPVDTTGWRLPIDRPPSVCPFPSKMASMRARLVHHLGRAYAECGFRPRGEYAVIFASSKGCLEDWVWKGGDALDADPLTPVLTDFLDAHRLSPRRAVCISNACASGHGALFLARQWLRRGMVGDVLVLGADGVGPFVVHGFRSLGALSATRCQPFSATRDGLRLGEAAAAIWLAARPESELRLPSVSIETEGYAVTRSSENGAGLESTLRQIGGEPPDFVIAHGTGTQANDRVEDRVLHAVFGERAPVTGTKWSVGHALGASGLLDTIAAGEALRRQRGFALRNTVEIDPRFQARYWRDGDPSITLRRPRAAVVTSLGFGGMNAAIRLEVAQ